MTGCLEKLSVKLDFKFWVEGPSKESRHPNIL
jgi:hypothetical protein